MLPVPGQRANVGKLNRDVFAEECVALSISPASGIRNNVAMASWRDATTSSDISTPSHRVTGYPEAIEISREVGGHCVVPTGHLEVLSYHLSFGFLDERPAIVWNGHNTSTVVGFLTRIKVS